MKPIVVDNVEYGYTLYYNPFSNVTRIAFWRADNMTPLHTADMQGFIDTAVGMNIIKATIRRAINETNM